MSFRSITHTYKRVTDTSLQAKQFSCFGRRLQARRTIFLSKKIVSCHGQQTVLCVNVNHVDDTIDGVCDRKANSPYIEQSAVRYQDVSGLYGCRKKWYSSGRKPQRETFLSR